MGRPETLIIRLTTSEKRELKRRAKAADASMSDIAREAIFSEGDPHIGEFILRTISKSELSENALTKLVRLLEDIRAFQDSISPEVFRLVENQFLEIIDDCATLKRRLRDDVVEYRRVAGLPPTGEPPHEIQPYEQTNAEHEQSLSEHKQSLAEDDQSLSEHDQSLAEEEDIKVDTTDVEVDTILRILKYIKSERTDEVMDALVYATLQELQWLLVILGNSTSEVLDEGPEVLLESGEDVESYDSTTEADDMAKSDETLSDEELSDEALVDELLSDDMLFETTLPDEGAVTTESEQSSGNARPEIATGDATIEEADDEEVTTEKAETSKGDVRSEGDDVEIQDKGKEETGSEEDPGYQAGSQERISRLWELWDMLND